MDVTQSVKWFVKIHELIKLGVLLRKSNHSDGRKIVISLTVTSFIKWTLSINNSPSRYLRLTRIEFANLNSKKPGSES